MKRCCISAASAAVLALSAAVANAAGEEGGHAYVNFDIGRSSVRSKVDGSQDGDPVWGFGVGYAFNRHLGVELFGRSMSFRLFDGLFGDTNYYPQDHTGVSVVGTLPFDEHWAVFGRLGAGRTRMAAASTSLPDQHQTEATFGAGVRFDLTPSWGFKLSALRFAKSEVTTTTLGVEFSF
jgi:opacity protein-like surface antigen